MKFYYVTNIFDLHIFDNETTSLWKNWNLHRNAFSLFIFSKWKKYHNLTFEDTFKMSFVNYSNLNSSSIKKPFLNHGPLNVIFCFSRLLIYVCFIETFVKDFMKKLSFFNINFQNLFQDVVYYRMLRCLTLWY